MDLSHKENAIKIITHECELPPVVDVIQKYIPDSGLLSSLRKKFIQLQMISAKNPLTNICFKSKSLITAEKYRHLQYYPYMLHPFSELRTWWETLMTIIITIQFLIYPLSLFLTNNQEAILSFYKQFTHTADVMCLMDVALNFFTGYYDTETKATILSPSKIVWMYLFPNFFIDTVSSLPFIFLTNNIFNTTSRRIQLEDLLIYLKVLLVRRMMLYLRHTQERFNINIFYFKLYKISLMTFIILIWSTSITFISAQYALLCENPQMTWVPLNFTDMPLDFKLAMLTFRSIYALLMIGYGMRRSYHVHDMTLTVFFFICGFIINVYIIYWIIQLIETKESTTTKYQQVLQQLHEYMRYKGLTGVLKRRIVSYYEFRFQKTFFKENEILSTLSGQLKQEIVLHTCRKLVESVPFFKGLPTTLLVRIVTFLRSDIFLPNDIIVQHGTAGDSMYFINSGTVAVYTSGGQEVCHLEDGAHFGEIALLTENEQRTATVIAIEACELFTLDRRDFRRAMDPYPDVYQRISKQAFERIERIIKLESESKNVFSEKFSDSRAYKISNISGLLKKNKI